MYSVVCVEGICKLNSRSTEGEPHGLNCVARQCERAPTLSLLLCNVRRRYTDGGLAAGQLLVPFPVTYLASNKGWLCEVIALSCRLVRLKSSEAATFSFASALAFVFAFFLTAADAGSMSRFPAD